MIIFLQVLLFLAFLFAVILFLGGMIFGAISRYEDYSDERQINDALGLWPIAWHGWRLTFNAYGYWPRTRDNDGKLNFRERRRKAVMDSRDRVTQLREHRERHNH